MIILPSANVIAVFAGMKLWCDYRYLTWKHSVGLGKNLGMDLFGVDIEGGLALAGRVHRKYRPVFDGLSPEGRAALAWYFLPHRSSKPIVSVTRPRILKWYCPFADQRDFASGHRYCINVYAGCGHGCEYCYAAGYEPDEANCKKDFEHGLLRDLEDLDRYDVPTAPVHMSNSTDAFQPLESRVGQAYFALKQVLRCRHRFSSVVVLTKNPAIPAEPRYLEILQELACLAGGHQCKAQFEQRDVPPLRLEVSMAFWRDEVGAFFDPGAPAITERVKAIRKLRVGGVAVVLRIDPLLPRSPLPEGKTLADFDLPEAQSPADLERLVAFAAEIGVIKIVYSVAKITLPRFKPLSETMQNLKRVYEHVAQPQRLVFHGGSWRLPHNIAQHHVVEPFLAICRRYDMPAMFCKQNLVSTP